MASTIRDIARSADVSAATVSRVLRGDRRNGFAVSDATQQRILNAAQELNYRPNIAARAMVQGRTGLIGVVIGSMSESFLERILAGVQSFAASRGLAIVLYTEQGSSDTAFSEHLIGALQARQLDGLIAAQCRLSCDVLEELRRQETPLVLLSPQAAPGYAAVHVNDEAGGRLAGEHLLSLGHQRIAFLGYHSIYSELRERGLSQLLAANGVRLRRRISPASGPSMQDQPWKNGEALAGQLLKRHPDTTAIVCSDDYNAVGVLAAAQKAGRRVPDDLSVVGYDDLYWTAFTNPPLTTIQQPKELQGTRAAELLLEVLAGGAPREVLLEPQLTQRASTAQVGAATQISNAKGMTP